VLRGQIDGECRLISIIRCSSYEIMRVCGLGSAGLYVIGGQLRFVHVPIRIWAGAGPMFPGAGRVVLSPAVPVLGRGGAPGGAGKSGDPLVYRYIYICHTLQSSTTKQA